jgi:L-alanine-DL-glutamate epimerase-like enolase superfamily enzyme
VRIDRVEAIPFRIPLKKPTRWGAHGKMTASEHVLVRVYGDSGAVGVAEATPRPTIYGETQVSIVHVIAEHFAPRLTGLNPLDRQGYWAVLDSIPWNPTAKGGLDIAIHDLMAQELGISLAELLGGRPIPVPISYLVGLGTVEELLEEAGGIRELTGVNAFKVKAGADPAGDVERVRLLRQALGDEGFIFIDANQLYSPEVAIRVINEMAAHGLAMAEEPVPVHLGVYRRKVADAVTVPILADDSVITLAEARRELEGGAIGVMGIKTPRTGMVNSLKILHLAEAFGVPCWVGSQGVSGVGTLASAHFYGAASRNIPFPADLGTYLKQVDDLLETPIDLRDGRIHLPDLPGSGARIDEAKLKQYRMDR